jgi:head-tail adaptor
MGSGDLRGRFTFLSISPSTGALGTKRGTPVAEFTIPGQLIPRFGGEQVMAGRLQSVQPFTLRVRQGTRTRRITTDWQAQNLKTGETFNIRTIADPNQKRMWLDLLIESGVAA